MYAKRIREMIAAYESFSGRHFSADGLRSALARNLEAGDLSHAPENKDGLRIGLVGARYSGGIRNLLDDAGVSVLFDLTCSRFDRNVCPDDISEIKDDGLLDAYAHKLLSQVPCLRMADASGRRDYIDGFSDRLDGIIYHTVKFCDNYSYEYSEMHSASDIPILKIETDLTAQCEGQIRTRIEAFLETLRALRGDTAAGPENKKAAGAARKESEMTYVLGIDSGSTSTNAVIMDGNKKIIAKGSVRTGAKTSGSAEKILDDILKTAGLKKEDLSMIVSTGYGRVSIPFADMNVTEISCHGRGARYFDPDVRTILDIGGQDSKAIRLNADGEVTDFVMNDKCAAGTGRFLEAMARTLEMDISELGPISLKSTENVTISSMCTVFAESEVISLIAQNKEKSRHSQRRPRSDLRQGPVASPARRPRTRIHDDRRRCQKCRRHTLS
jgi:predicted CoA-substrate-specific enzyme activase